MMKRRWVPLAFAFSSLFIAALPAPKPAATPSSAPAPADTTAPAAPVIELSRSVEDGKPVLTAKVSQEGKPAANVTVAFSVARTFGFIALGQDTTLDDGTAAVPFPDSLPGEADGSLKIRALLTAPAAFENQEITLALPAIRSAPSRALRFPRALWAPRAPVPLLATLMILLGGVWLTYGYVIVQIKKIKQEGSP